ncbi:MAG: uridine diphosphate-N-acetylglucosamine-binding protein YvcK [Microthrixaceae bacterium]
METSRSDPGGGGRARARRRHARRTEGGGDRRGPRPRGHVARRPVVHPADLRHRVGGRQRGSSGRLRSARDQAAPGDLRKCLVALAGDSLLAATLEHRFDEAELRGHALGNLLLSALTQHTGSLVGAVDELARILEVSGRVLPATTVPVDLVARTLEGREVRGQVEVMASGGIDRVRIDPLDAPVPGDAIDAIVAADLLVVGPGSLFTSVLAAAAVPAVRDAVASAAAPLVYVCNLHPQERESLGYDVGDHVAALERHGLVPDVVVYDPDQLGGAEGVVGAWAARLADEAGTAHDHGRLGAVLGSLVP